MKLYVACLASTRMTSNTAGLLWESSSKESASLRDEVAERLQGLEELLIVTSVWQVDV